MELAEYASCDASELAELIRTGEVTANEVAALARKGIEKVNGMLNAVIDVLPWANDEPPTSIGNKAKPFNGVPFLIKDLGLSIRGVPCDAGSRLLHGAQSAQVDSELLERFCAAGLSILGRTNTPEFGYATTTEPVLYGPTRNPWDLQLSPGGSSGGSAAAVAAGIVPIAHGTDAGGSIRIPASACGLVGLKPTRGRLPTGPHTSNPINGLGTAHVLCRTVRDAACALDTVVGVSPGDPYILAAPERRFWSTHRPTKSLRIAFTALPWQTSAPIHQDCVAAIEHTAALCEELGHAVAHDFPRYGNEAFHRANRIFWTSWVAGVVRRAELLTGRRASPENLETANWQTYQAGQLLTALDIFEAEALANGVRRSVAQFFEQYDILLTPTMAVPPWRLGALDANDPRHDAEGWYYSMFERVPFTALYNMTGQPAISVPLHSNGEGLPIGIQAVARVGEEPTLFALAVQLEEAAPWSHRVPPVHVAQAN